MRSAVIAAGVCISLIGASLAQASAAVTLTPRVETHIPPRALESALKQFAKLEHMRVLYLDVAIDNIRSSGASGYLTANETLNRLLSGTGLRYRYVATDAVSIISSSYRSYTTPNSFPQPSLDSPQTARSSRGVSARRRPAPEEANSSVAKTPDPPATDQSSQHARSTQRLGEVIVTAQKYRQRALDVPISLVVIGSQQLQEENITTLNDLQYDVPGLRVEGGGAQQRVIIRGVGNDYGNGSYVSEYIDDADVTASGYSGATGYGGTALQTYDLARVEVLRGPQGTLYGDSALGGTIRLITNHPALDLFEMTLSSQAEFTEYGAPSQNIEAMINAPIASTLALRITGEFNHDGGWIDEPAANLKNINGDNLTDTRIEGVWAPSVALNVRVTQILHREADGLSQGEDANGNFIPPFNSMSVPNAHKTFNLSNLTVACDFARMRLLSSSTYLTSDETLDNYSENEIGVAVSLHNDRDSQEKFAQEMRLASTGAGPWRWTIGGFYDHDQSDLVAATPEYVGLYSIPITLSSLADAIQAPGTFELQGSSSRAAFGDASYKLWGRFTVGVGARYYRDRETAAGNPNSPNNATFTSTDPRAYVDFNVTPQTNIYASASKGFRSGGFNPYTGPYSPESLWNYELGTKLQVAALAANADVFWSDYSNYLGSAIVPGLSPLPETYNIGAARIKGFEGELNWRMSTHWLLSVSGDYLDAKLVSIASSAFEASYNVGDQVPLSSKYQFTASIERDFSWNQRPVYARLNYSQLSPQISYDPVEYSDRIRMLGFEASIQWYDTLTLGVFAQNLLNDRGLLDPYSALGFASRPRPRTFGADFSMALGNR
jgi:outer membrane receptor protein involved in Fe transport